MEQLVAVNGSSRPAIARLLPPPVPVAAVAPTLQRAINPLKLSAMQRILLATDGTVTDILEMYAGESMRVIKLHQEQVGLKQPLPSMDLDRGDTVLNRTILLQGKMSLVNQLYAESVIVPDRLDPGVRDGLILSKKPIGLLLLEHRLETFREILECWREFAGPLGQYFHVDEEATIIARTYRIFSGRQPIMLITEKFPESYFRS